MKLCRPTALRCALAILILAGASAFAADPDPAEADRLFRDGRHEEALAIWQDLIANHRKDRLVENGDAAREAAKCLAVLDRHAEGVKLLRAWVKRHPKADGVFAARRTVFDLLAESEDAKGAQKAGRKLFADFPDARGCYVVAREYLRREWKLPKLGTSYGVWRKWTYDRTDGTKDPDLRLAFLEAMERLYPKEDAVKEGGTLYAKSWAHWSAGRFAEAIELGQRYLARDRNGPVADRAHMTLARSYAALQPPQRDEARKHLRAVLAIRGSKKHREAEQFLAEVDDAGVPRQFQEGLPRADGLGRVALVTNLPKNGKHMKALSPWIEARDAQVVRYSGNSVQSASKALAKLGSEFVAVAALPTDVDINYHLDVLEMSRGLDDDALPDFHFGYLLARDADDLAAFVQRILAKKPAKDAAARDIGKLEPSKLAGLDVALHFGHGTPNSVVKALSGKEIARLRLEGAPVIFSGCCFNGVTSRSYHRSAGQYRYLKPTEMHPDELVSLGWVEAGVGGFVAALEGDRGEMAMAEWDHLLETACSLGESVGIEYRLAYTFLPDGHRSFPRFVPGQGKSMRLEDVMLRGMVSRLLLGDPSLRPLAAPVRARSTESRVEQEKDTLVVRVRVARPSGGRFINCLPRSGNMPFDWKVLERVPLPEGFDATLGHPAVSVIRGDKEIETTRYHVRHEVWGGRRFVNFQVESLSGAIASPGTEIVLRFPQR